jgi:hypothetical protein
MQVGLSCEVQVRATSREHNDKGTDLRRRELLARAATLTGVLTLNITLAIRNVLAMGDVPAIPGVRHLKGTLTINGKVAKIGDLVAPGDTLVTGPDSEAVVVHNRDALLLRANTTLQIDSDDKTLINFMRVTAGAVLSVWGPRKQAIGITTPLASIGIRGTGIYVDSTPEFTYACTCYGVADLEPVAAPEKRRTVKTTYHDAPFFIYPNAEQPLVSGPVINHTDEELIMLEALFRRVPPFTTHPNYGEGGGGY